MNGTTLYIEMALVNTFRSSAIIAEPAAPCERIVAANSSLHPLSCTREYTAKLSGGCLEQDTQTGPRKLSTECVTR